MSGHSPKGNPKKRGGLLYNLGLTTLNTHGDDLQKTLYSIPFCQTCMQLKHSVSHPSPACWD